MPRISPLALRLKHHINFPSDVSHPPLTNLAEHILQPFLHAQPKIRARADPSNGLWMNSTVLVTKEDARTGWNPAYAASLKIPANLRGAEGHLERRALAARGGWYPHSKRVAGFNRNSPTAFLWRKTVQPHSFYSSIVKKAETPLVELMATPGKSWEAMGVHLRHRVDGMNGADKGWVPCFESSDPRERLGGLAESVESKWLDIEAGKVVDMPVAEPETATIPATAAPATPKQPKSPKQPKQTPALSGSPWSFPVPAPQKFVAKGTPAPAPAPKPAPPAAEKQTTRAAYPYKPLSEVPVAPAPTHIPVRQNIIKNPLMSGQVAASYVAWHLARGGKPESVMSRMIARLTGDEKGEREERPRRGGRREKAAAAAEA